MLSGTLSLYTTIIKPFGAEWFKCCCMCERNSVVLFTCGMLCICPVIGGCSVACRLATLEVWFCFIPNVRSGILISVFQFMLKLSGYWHLNTIKTSDTTISLSGHYALPTWSIASGLSGPNLNVGLPDCCHTVYATLMYC